MESRWQCLHTLPPPCPAELSVVSMDSQTQTRRSSLSRICPSQVKELELLGALRCCCGPCSSVELSVCPRTVCAPALCQGSGRGWGSWAPTRAAGAALHCTGYNSHLGSTRLLLLNESISGSARGEAGRRLLLTESAADSTDTHDPGSQQRILQALLPALYRSELIPSPTAALSPKSAPGVSVCSLEN